MSDSLRWRGTSPERVRALEMLRRNIEPYTIAAATVVPVAIIRLWAKQAGITVKRSTRHAKNWQAAGMRGRERKKADRLALIRDRATKGDG